MQTRLSLCMMILTLISRCQTINVSQGKEMTYIQIRKESLLQEADGLEASPLCFAGDGNGYGHPVSGCFTGTCFSGIQRGDGASGTL